MDYVVGQDEASAKPATLDREDIQSTKPVAVWLLTYAFDHTCGQAPYGDDFKLNVNKELTQKSYLI